MSNEDHEYFMKWGLGVLVYLNVMLRAHMHCSLDNDDDTRDHLSATALQLSHRSEDTFYMQYKPLVVKVIPLRCHTDCLSDLSC